MTAVELTAEQARYLSILATNDIMRDVKRGLTHSAGRHGQAWNALQAACDWEPLPEGEDDEPQA
jgi:hypothetical protein